MVKKKDGQQEAFDMSKIRQAVEFACEGLDVNVDTLVEKFDEFLYDGISTQVIQQNLIHHAKTLCSPTSLDWVFVAGRLHTMDRWSSTRSYDLSFPAFVKKQIKDKIWEHKGFKTYTKSDLKEISSFLTKERDLKHSYASVITAEDKYLLKNECIQHCFLGEAMIIHYQDDKTVRLKNVFETYDYLSNRQISLASPWLGNLRSGGNIASCFITAPDDNLKSIYDMLADSAFISKAGGGEGIDFSRCRAKGSDLMGFDNRAGGVIGWIKLANETAVWVNQAGKRKGAITCHLALWHKDIIDFLSIQTEVGDLRNKAFDIKPQVGVHDLFMEMKEEYGNTWYMFCPHEVESKLGIRIYECYGDAFRKAYFSCVEAVLNGILQVYTSVDAKELWKTVMKRQFETGMPYIAFLDTINETNPNKHIGYIPCVNLCTESFSVVVPDKYTHTCNLASIVVGRVKMEELSEVAGVLTRILNNGIDLSNYPTPESEAHSKAFRTIGIGVQGLHDLLAREHKSYKDLDFITEVFERIEYGFVKASIELAKQHGAYPFFKGSEWDNGNMTKCFAKNSVCKDIDWLAVQKDIDLYGIYNSQGTSPAPNTSTSIFMDAAAGVQPVHCAFFYEDNKSGMLPVVAMYLKENPLSYARDITRYDPYDLAESVGAAQKFVDTGISAEYIMDKNRPNFKAKVLWDTLNAAWKAKTKAVYYVRTVKEGEKLVKSVEDCIGCAG